MEPITERDETLALEILRDLVRIDSSNPPGNELAAAIYLQKRLEPYHLETHLFETAPQRGNLVARLAGSGEAKPLLLLGHLDVVPANGQDWLHPPFAAEVHDGMVWGRGTTDMKQMLAVSTVILLVLSRLGYKLKRDLVLVAAADEEQGSACGMDWLVHNAPELLVAEGALNEGGGSCFVIGGHPFYTCQVAEKGICRTQWIAYGKDGHGSQPSANISTLKLSRALVSLGDGHIRSGVVATMRDALSQIACQRSASAAEQVAQLLTQNRIEEALIAAGFDNPTMRATRPLFYDTAAATALRAGDPQAINVIPSHASAFVDGRILPGQTQEGFIQALRQRCGQELEIELYDNQFNSGQELSSSTLLLKTIAQVISSRCQGASVVPWMCTGATDARQLAALGIPVYGFVPAMPLPEGVQEVGPHAVNERLWLKNLSFALHILYEVVFRYCVELGAPA